MRNVDGSENNSRDSHEPSDGTPNLDNNTANSVFHYDVIVYQIILIWLTVYSKQML